MALRRGRACGDQVAQDRPRGGRSGVVEARQGGGEGEGADLKLAQYLRAYLRIRETYAG